LEGRQKQEDGLDLIVAAPWYGYPENAFNKRVNSLEAAHAFVVCEIIIYLKELIEEANSS
jgi:hypothetical protein